MKKLTLSEADVTTQVKSFLQALGWRPLRMQRTVIKGQFQTGEPGIPDFLFLHYQTGGILWIEFKSEKGRLSNDQKDWHATERLKFPAVTLLTISSLQQFQQWHALNQHKLYRRAA